MVSDRIFDLCLPVLEDDSLDEEATIDKLEDLLSSEPVSLKGRALEDAVLGALWQYKSVSDVKKSPPPARAATVVRSHSPAPWIQRAATPTSASNSPRPAAATPYGTPTSSGIHPPVFARTKSSTAASPFSSPRPSPRLPLATPIIPHSPSLSAYKFSDSSPTTENYGDYGSENVDWLVNDDASSSTSFGDSGFNSASEFMSSYTTEMSPYDMLRSILQENRSDEELEQILEANGYDLSQTINALMEAQGGGEASSIPPSSPRQQSQAQSQSHTKAQHNSRGYLIGKNMSPNSRPATPAGQQKSPVVCRYWLASGTCARADCRFAHEVQNTHLCKYWLAGNCIAGSSCLFSHDPSLLMQRLNLEGGTPSDLSSQQYGPNFQISDLDSFPALQPTTSNPYEDEPMDPVTLNAVLGHQQQGILAQPPPGLFPNFVPTGPRLSAGSGSRPGSRHRAPTPSLQPNFQDDEAFPTLGTAATKPSGKRHHGKRGGHGQHHNTAGGYTLAVQQPSSLADVVRLSPSPASPSSSKDAMRRGLRNNRSFTSSRENSTTAMAIPAPKDIPWLETGDRVNTAYLKARQEAFKHGGLRNKFLQSAAQAWNRNDARGAKALSLRGQNENALMREKHREAARALYEERNKSLASGNSRELYVDLHGLHPEEAVQYLTDCLKEQTKSSRPVYAICGTGHHSKNGKDKVGKAIRQFLNEWRYAFREFSVPGDRNNVGGILGIDPTSFDRDAVGKGPDAAGGVAGSNSGRSSGGGDGDSGVGLDERSRREDTKILLVKTDPRKAGAAAGIAAGAE